MKYFSTIMAACIIALTLISSAPKNKAGDCALVMTYAEMAFMNFKKAHQAASPSEAAPLIKKAIEEVEQAAAYAVNPKCNCQQAENYALNAVTFGIKASKDDDAQDQQKQIKKAMNASLDVLTAIPLCK